MSYTGKRKMRAEKMQRSKSMDEIRNTINTMLVNTFHEILELEEKAIITDKFRDISNNDMHIIEAIGEDSGARMTDIARKLNITVGSLTTSMNSLVNKGYVSRKRPPCCEYISP